MALLLSVDETRELTATTSTSSANWFGTDTDLIVPALVASRIGGSLAGVLMIQPAAVSDVVLSSDALQPLGGAELATSASVSVDQGRGASIRARIKNVRRPIALVDVFA